MFHIGYSMRARGRAVAWNESSRALSIGAMVSLLVLAALLAGCEQAGRPDRAHTAPMSTVATVAPNHTVYPPRHAYPRASRNRFANAETNPIKEVDRQPVSTFGADVDTASYAVVRRFLRDGTMPPPAAVRIEEMVNYFPYDYAMPRDREAPFAATASLFPSPWSGNHLLHIAVKGYDKARTRRPPLNLVLLIDVSGSMSPNDRLPLLKRSFRMLAKTMGARDRVSIVTYAGTAQVALRPTAGNRQQTILNAIDSLSSGGGTYGRGGIKLAYRLAEESFDAEAVNRVVLATDGDFNIGMTDPNALKEYIAEKRKTGVYLSVLGVGTGNLNDNLMQKLAQTGNGNAAYIDSLQEARKVFVEETSANLFPIADDLKIQVEFNPARISHYRLIGYETRALRNKDFDNDRVDAGDIGSGHTVTALYEVTLAGDPAPVRKLRYAQVTKPKAQPAKTSKRSNEFAFVRMRYKLPGGKTSRLIERPVTEADRHADFVSVPADHRFATAVAAFGQLLRNDKAETGDGKEGLNFDRVETLARGARGGDKQGYRSEFLQLVRLAKSIRE